MTRRNGLSLLHDARRFVEGHEDALVAPIGSVHMLPEMPRLTDPRGTQAWKEIVQAFSRGVWPASVPPLVVMPLDGGNGLALIDGRMRLVAATMHGLPAAPCRIVGDDGPKDAPFLWRFFVAALEHRNHFPPIEMIVWMAQAAPFRPSHHLYPPEGAPCTYDEAVAIAQRLHRTDLVRIAGMDEDEQADFVRRAVAAVRKTKKKRGD